MSSIVSRCEVEGRLERRWRTCDFGRRGSSRSPADWTRGTSQGGAPGRGERDRREREGWSSLAAPKSTENAHGYLQTPARNVDGLAASQVTGGEGKARGGLGLFIGVAGASKRAGSEGN
jgi:hypothetical protein